jgi:hypothetical protein
LSLLDWRKVPGLAEEFAKQKSQKHETGQILSSWRRERDSNLESGSPYPFEKSNTFKMLGSREGCRGCPARTYRHQGKRFRAAAPQTQLQQGHRARKSLTRGACDCVPSLKWTTRDSRSTVSRDAISGWRFAAVVRMCSARSRARTCPAHSSSPADLRCWPDGVSTRTMPPVVGSFPPMLSVLHPSTSMAN